MSRHEVVNINLKSKPDWFLALNPLGQVPVLQIDDKVVPESTATCDWLDEVYPENRLQPADPYRRAWDRVLYEQIGKVRRYLDSIDRYRTIVFLTLQVTFFKDLKKCLGWNPEAARHSVNAEVDFCHKCFNIVDFLSIFTQIGLRVTGGECYVQCHIYFEYCVSANMFCTESFEIIDYR